MKDGLEARGFCGEAATETAAAELLRCGSGGSSFPDLNDCGQSSEQQISSVKRKNRHEPLASIKLCPVGEHDNSRD